jgi:hypothetical protein
MLTGLILLERFYRLSLKAPAFCGAVINIRYLGGEFRSLYAVQHQRHRRFVFCSNVRNSRPATYLKLKQTPDTWPSVLKPPGG